MELKTAGKFPCEMLLNSLCGCGGVWSKSYSGISGSVADLLLISGTIVNGGGLWLDTLYSRCPSSSCGNSEI